MEKYQVCSPLFGIRNWNAIDSSWFTTTLLPGCEPKFNTLEEKSPMQGLGNTRFTFAPFIGTRSVNPSKFPLWQQTNQTKLYGFARNWRQEAMSWAELFHPNLKARLNRGLETAANVQRWWNHNRQHFSSSAHSSKPKSLASKTCLKLIESAGSTVAHFSIHWVLVDNIPWQSQLPPRPRVMHGIADSLEGIPIRHMPYASLCPVHFMMFHVSWRVFAIASPCIIIALITLNMRTTCWETSCTPLFVWGMPCWISECPATKLPVHHGPCSPLLASSNMAWHRTPEHHLRRRKMSKLIVHMCRRIEFPYGVLSMECLMLTSDRRFAS